MESGEAHVDVSIDDLPVVRLGDYDAIHGCSCVWHYCGAEDESACCLLRDLGNGVLHCSDAVRVADAITHHDGVRSNVGHLSIRAR